VRPEEYGAQEVGLRSPQDNAVSSVGPAIYRACGTTWPEEAEMPSLDDACEWNAQVGMYQ